jgi:hypothetical protein
MFGGLLNPVIWSLFDPVLTPAVIDKILRHLRTKGRDARAGPWATGPPGGR